MNTNLIITPAELAELSSDNCIIFDCRFSLDDHDMGRNLYKEAHIAGAHFLDMEEDLAGAKTGTNGRHPLPDSGVFENKLCQCGVNHDSLIVCYDDQRLAGAARLWWLLDYFGHSNVKILDGGFKAWQAAGLPVETDTPTVKAIGDFSAIPNAEIVVPLAEVLGSVNADVPTMILVDSREEPRYNGEQEPIDPIAGHIPGALNYAWQHVTNEDGSVKEPAFHQQHWASLKPILEQGKDVAVYCGSGVTACVNLFSMRLAGINSAKLYSGSWSEWCANLDHPIATL